VNGCPFYRFTAGSSYNNLKKNMGKLSVNHLVVSLPDNRRQARMPAKMNK